MSTTVQVHAHSREHSVSLFSTVTSKAPVPPVPADVYREPSPSVRTICSRPVIVPVARRTSSQAAAAAAAAAFVLLHTQQGDRSLLHGAAAGRQAGSLSLLLLLHRAAQAHSAPLCALLFALCLNCRRALKNIIPHRGNVGQVGPSRDPEQG